MIKRLSSKILKHLLTQNPVVALLGARQVGKTTLARQIADAYKDASVYLDLENSRDLRKLEDPLTFFEINKDKLVIIDEVQTMPQIFRDLRPSIDNLRTPERFLLLGSASPSLVKGVSETLTGRIAYLELTPFNLIEAYSNSIAQETLWLRGGFPLSLLAEKNSISMNWRRAFLRSYIHSELAQIFHVELTPVIIQNFWQMLAHYHGGIWNANTFAISLGVTAPTVRRYLDYMEGAFLVRRLNPWFLNAKKRLVKSPKVFLRDSGILHILLNVDELNDLFGHPGAGASWEGFVIEQIAALLPENIRPFFYRTHQGAEADLLLVKGIKPIAAIEIKLSNSPVISKGFYECIRDLKTGYNFVITPNSDTYITKGNIKVCSLVSFIKKYLHNL